MYSHTVRRNALNRISQGQSLRSISLLTGVSRSTLREWRDHPVGAYAERADCPRCGSLPRLPTPTASYAYLLGLYLGDGCISAAGDRRKQVWALRIMCADTWPGLLEECKQAMHAVRPANAIYVQPLQGCSEVRSCSKHWPCFFPQHGLGRKHERKIELDSWQQQIVSKHTGEFVRGLFHSDGYRGINRVRGPLVNGDRWYEYPRYLFVNRSADILRLCGEGLDRLGVEWRFSKPTTISVARREAVARLDRFVGPKY